jgi:hypothetical protein
MIKPVSPDEIVALKKTVFPDGVIQAINNVIAKNFDGKRSYFLQKVVAQEICEAMGVSMDAAFANKWLDFEPIYEAEGWKVYYDKPAYNESYEASFTLSRK